MPLEKYYCDYCDKQFQDTPSARKRHLQGVQHQRARKLWFDSFKDPQQLHAENAGKAICTRFVKMGFCQFGDNCKYFHPVQNIEQHAGVHSGTGWHLKLLLGIEGNICSSIDDHTCFVTLHAKHSCICHSFY